MYSTLVYVLSHFSPIWLCETLWTVAHQAPLSTGFLQARIVKWVTMPSSRGSSRPKDQTHVSCTSCIGRQNLYHWAPWKALTLPNPLSNLFSRYWFSHAWPILTSCFCYCFLLVDIACYSAAGGNEIGLAHFSLHRAKFSGRQRPFLSRHKSTIW